MIFKNKFKSILLISLVTWQTDIHRIHIPKNFSTEIDAAKIATMCADRRKICYR